jgi:hypothetical protein
VDRKKAMRIPEGANWAAVRQYLKATRASEYDRLRHQHHYHHQQQQQQQTRLAAACCSSSSDQTVSTLTFLLFPFGSHVDSPGPNNNATSSSSNIIGRRNFFSSILTDSIFQRQPRDSLKSWIPTTLLSSERRFFFLGPGVASSSSTTTNDMVPERQQQHCLTRVSLNPPLLPPLGLSNHLLSEGRRLLISSSRDPTSICSVFFFFLKSQYSTASGPECGQQKQLRDYGSNYGQADANVGPSMQDDGSEVVGVGRDVEGSDCSKGHHHQGGSLHSEHEVSRTESETGWSREDVVNWPNAISLARLLSGPLLAGMILQGFPRAALIGLALAGASDWLDGFVARKLGVNSVLGSYLDPLADKVSLFTAASIFWFFNPDKLDVIFLTVKEAGFGGEHCFVNGLRRPSTP